MLNHTPGCPMSAFRHSDGAKRVSDTYALHFVVDPVNAIGHWFAVALEDGRTDGVLYDTRQECVSHQHHNEMYYAYIQIAPSVMDTCAAEVFLKTHRQLYASGVRLTDPAHRNGGLSVIPRLTKEDQRSQMRSIRSGGRIRSSNLILPGDR
jgi:hypothetical protein